jgi:hypothetical protein
VLKRRGKIIPLMEKFCMEKQLSFRISMNEVLDYCVLEYHLLSGNGEHLQATSLPTQQPPEFYSNTDRD